MDAGHPGEADVDQGEQGFSTLGSLSSEGREQCLGRGRSVVTPHAAQAVPLLVQVAG